MAMYWPTPGFKGRMFKLCVLTRWDFNFCTCSSPMQGLSMGTCTNHLWQKTGWPHLFCVHTQEHVLATLSARKNLQDVLEKNEVDWSRKFEIRKKFLAVTEACMTIFWPTPGLKGEPLPALSSQQRGPTFLHLQFPTGGQQQKNKI